MFQGLQDVVNVCPGVGRFDIKFPAEGNFAESRHIGNVGAGSLVLQFGDGGFRGIEQAEKAVDEVCFVFRLYELGKTVKEFGGIDCHCYGAFC